jgi:hypothetical protein
MAFPATVNAPFWIATSKFPASWERMLIWRASGGEVLSGHLTGKKLMIERGRDVGHTTVAQNAMRFAFQVPAVGEGLQLASSGCCYPRNRRHIADGQATGVTVNKPAGLNISKARQTRCR